ncbi:hypothetical protein [Streptomyces sp. NPDC052012]
MPDSLAIRPARPAEAVGTALHAACVRHWQADGSRGAVLDGGMKSAG